MRETPIPAVPKVPPKAVLAGESVVARGVRFAGGPWGYAAGPRGLLFLERTPINRLGETYAVGKDTPEGPSGFIG